MASIGLAADNVVSRGDLRTFYLTGTGLDPFRSPGPLRPALLEQLPLPHLERSYPIYVADSGSPQPWFLLLQALISASPDSFAILRDSVELIAGAFADQLAPGQSTPVSAVLEAALAATRSRLEMLHAPAQSIDKELGILRKALPSQGELIPFGDSTLPLLISATLRNARREARQSFAQSLANTCQRLRELLDSEDRKAVAASSPERITSSLGARAASFLNTASLAQALRRRSKPVLPMEPERRARCEAALATIQDAIHDENRQPWAILITSKDAPNGDACEHAVDLCRQQLIQHTSILKALRIARLEVESAFDPAVHLETLDSFDWSLARPEELAALPAVVVVETAPHIERSLLSFVRLLQSGLPVKVLIACAEGPCDSLGFLPMAFQDAFTLQSSVACADHLINGFADLARTLRPAVALVAAGAWTASALLPFTGAFPLYRYNPDLGESWYQRFAAESDRPPEFESLSFAHVAALIPAFRNHFRILPETAPLEAAIPSLLVTDADGEQRHAVFTRELENAGSAAQRRGKFLAELAAPKVVKQADPGAQDQARLDGATQAIHRVISILREG